MQNLKAQLDASEKIRAQQQLIIENQKNQISVLQAANSKLRTELSELRSFAESLSSDYEEVVSICQEQQKILNSLTDS